MEANNEMNIFIDKISNLMASQLKINWHQKGQKSAEAMKPYGYVFLEV